MDYEAQDVMQRVLFRPLNLISSHQRISRFVGVSVYIVKDFLPGIPIIPIIIKGFYVVVISRHARRMFRHECN